MTTKATEPNRTSAATSTKAAGSQPEPTKGPEATKTAATAPAASAKVTAAQSEPAKAAEATKPAATAPAQPAAAGKGPQSPSLANPGPSPLPKTWDEIRVGSIVLTPANEGETYGWWEAVVTAITNDLLTLRWRDYPREPIKARRRHEVALLFSA